MEKLQNLTNRKKAQRRQIKREEEESLEINEDQIMKKYKLIKQERRLLCIKTYDVIEKYKKWIEKQQLKLFKDG